MATFKNCTGSIFDSQCEVLVNPVNCVGVMGKGLALEFKKRYPEMFEDYVEMCEQRILRIGLVILTCNSTLVLFPTKRHWRDSSKIEDIISGLNALGNVLAYRIDYMKREQSIAIPALGCGLGGLDWADVEPLIREKLGTIDWLDVELYGPHGSRSVD